MRLSKNFTLKELTRSNTALRLGIDNEPSKEGIYKLTLLATEVLQPLRDCLGALRITSGFRSPELNKAIGGSTKSQHCKYEAVDLQYFKRGKMDNIKIYQALKELGLPFDQVILEFGDATEYIDPENPAWIHLSYTINDNRCQELVAYKDQNNKTKYRTVTNYNSV
jgi:zinc D-Ala-D-Ala carboxypeptidase|tara:strand:+ start:351 stop:848 length:498 start_codon:yes stop_codon:yes gene_type:complete